MMHDNNFGPPHDHFGYSDFGYDHREYDDYYHMHSGANSNGPWGHWSYHSGFHGTSRNTIKAFIKAIIIILIVLFSIGLLFAIICGIQIAMMLI